MLTRWLNSLGHALSVILFSIAIGAISLSTSSLISSLFDLQFQISDAIISSLLPIVLAAPILHMVFRAVSQLSEAKAKLEVLASTDPLTGIYNRTRFIQLAEKTLANASPVETAGLVVIDIDRFKLINDTYGHLVGDEALKMIVRTVKLHLSQDAIFGRFGGDEFILLAPNTSRDEVETLCKLIIEHIHTLSVGIQEVRTRLSITMGATTAVPSVMTLNDMIARADAALLQAKRQGGGRLRYI